MASVAMSFDTGGRYAFSNRVAEPEELAKLGAAFDAAWLGINDASTIGATAQAAARERLGYIIVDLWKADPEQDLAARAVEQFIAVAEELPNLDKMEKAK